MNKIQKLAVALAGGALATTVLTSPADAAALNVYVHETSRYGLNIYSGTHCNDFHAHVSPGEKAPRIHHNADIFYQSFWQYENTYVTIFFPGGGKKHYSNAGKKICRWERAPHATETFRIGYSNPR